MKYGSTAATPVCITRTFCWDTWYSVVQQYRLAYCVRTTMVLLLLLLLRTAAVLHKCLCHAMRVRTSPAAFYTSSNLASMWCSRTSTSNTRTRRRTSIGLFGINILVSFWLGRGWYSGCGGRAGWGGEGRCRMPLIAVQDILRKLKFASPEG